jgi:hypothetical protein
VEAKQRGQGTCTGVEQLLGLESLLGSDQKGRDDRWVHLSAVRKRERVSWASRWITGRQLVIAPRPSKDLSRKKEDRRMGWKHRQRENELDVP